MPNPFNLPLTFLTIASVLVVTSARAQDDVIPTAQGDAVVHPVGHASVLITWISKRILIDPAPSMAGSRGAAAAGRSAAGGGPVGGGGGDCGRGGGAGAPPTPPPADAIVKFQTLGAPHLILVGHAHGDHFSRGLLAAIAGPEAVLGVPQIVYDALPEALKAKATIMANGDTSILAGIEVRAAPAYNVAPERLRNHPEGDGYVLALGGQHFYFAGGTEKRLELAHLTNIDVAFIPMNQPTETPEAAPKWMRDFRPRIVYPSHYSNGDLTAFVQGVGDASEVRLRKWY